MKSYKYSPLKHQAALGILTTSNEATPRGNYILVKDKPSFLDLGFKGYISTENKLPLFAKTGCKAHMISPIQTRDGDIALIQPSGEVLILWESDSPHNALFLTDACNARCLMCPQPPKVHDPIHIRNAHRILNLLRNKQQNSICITGGEPTLNKRHFLKIFERCILEHPESHIEILTNGQTLSNFDFTKQIARISTNNVRFCISLHADCDNLHDNIVQKEGSFRRTHLGILNLARFGISTEIRFVINKMNYSRLPSLPDFIFRNYPFIDHLAIMGLEMTGEAKNNADRIWIDPVDYQIEILAFTQEARRRGLPFSIYNHQLCILPEESRPYARKSISDWKQKYIKTCENCSQKNHCCGVFTTAGNDLSRGIHPISNQQQGGEI